jgi:hypothetical protein
LDKFFAAIFEPASYRDWPGAKVDQSAASRNMPGEHAGANVFPLDRTQGIVELPIEIAGEPFINERVKELTDMPREFPGEGLAQPLFVNSVIDVLGSVAFRVLEVASITQSCGSWRVAPTTLRIVRIITSEFHAPISGRYMPGKSGNTDAPVRLKGFVVGISNGANALMSPELNPWLGVSAVSSFR